MKLNVTKAVVLALTSSLILLLAGCANFTSPARKHSLDSGSYWMDYDASRRGMLVLDSPQEGRKWVVCSEPAPDVALNLVNKIEGDLTAGDTDIAGGKAEVTASAIKLAERTQMVSFLRESLFRLCELSLGNEFTADQSKEMYLKVLQTALTIVEKDRAEAEEQRANAEADAENAKTLNSLIDQGVDIRSLNPQFFQ